RFSRDWSSDVCSSDLVIAHVDHGKTTMSDSLLAASGIISPSVAGQALALDSMKLEQNRQMTIRGANVTLFYETDGKEYVINMIRSEERRVGNECRYG